jgi:outer membrane receptor protein involved in Fe transport
MPSSIRISILLAATAAVLPAAEIRGTVLDPSKAAIPNAQVAAVTRVGVVAQTTTGQSGAFELRLQDPGAAHLLVTAPGFTTRDIQLGAESGAPLEIELSLAAQSDSIRVAGTTMDVPLSQQGGSASVIAGEEIRERNEPLALDLLRYLPGMAVNQSGPPGSVGTVFIRGGETNYSLIEIDGVPVNSFGGDINSVFPHIPTDALERIEVIRGPQSAVYGPYANSGVVNFVTRTADDSPRLDLLAEGGSHYERHFVIGGSGMLDGFGIAAFLSRLDDNGPVGNSNYRNQSASLGITRQFRRQALALRAFIDANDEGEPGPYGSDPEHNFAGIDRISREKVNFSDYLVHYQVDLSNRWRGEIFGSFFINNTGFTSPYGSSFNRDLRGQGEARTVVSVTPWYTTSFGASFTREQVVNTYITNSSFDTFPLRRNEEGVYWENRFQLGNRVFLNAGVRADILHTLEMPADINSNRPRFPDNTITKVNPKIALAWTPLAGTRLHTSFGTGIRPPSGFDLGFTNNPHLKPERTTSFDAGIEQRLAANRLSLEATYFYNRYHDLIVSLGGSLARMSSFQSDNLANSRAQGLELSGRVRPIRSVSVQGTYTYLRSEILSLTGFADLAPNYFRVGQELLRRPTNSGAVVATWSAGRWAANVTGYFRGSVLDVEPNFGASAGFFRNPGYSDVGINLNYSAGHGLTLYGNLRNVLNQYYEEAFGFPALKLNFVAGMKWSLARAR